MFIFLFVGNTNEKVIGDVCEICGISILWTRLRVDSVFEIYYYCYIFRWTPPSRPNNMGRKMSVRLSVHKKFSSIFMTFGMYYIPNVMKIEEKFLRTDRHASLVELCTYYVESSTNDA